MPNFISGLLASPLFFGGYSFQAGAIEAFMHDTLVALKREKDYSKVMGRAQSYGLIGNVVLISLVPATYTIHHNLPFVLGFISLLVMLRLATSFAYPVDESDRLAKNPFKAFASIVSWQNIALFVFAGFTASVANKGGEYRELLFQDIGVAVALFGFFFGVLVRIDLTPFGNMRFSVKHKNCVYKTANQANHRLHSVGIRLFYLPNKPAYYPP